MSRFKLKIIRFIASCVYQLRCRIIKQTPVKWVVVSGTVGKTITRQTIAGALGDAGARIVSRESNYINELGVLCTLFDVGTFSFWSISAWQRLLCNQIKTDTYFCIEMGADFCRDIPWFLARFLPYIVVITADTDENWTGIVEKVRSDRLELCRHIIGYVLISDQVTEYLQVSFPDAIVRTNSDDLYSFPKTVARLVCIKEGLSEPLQVVPYHKNRFSITYKEQAVIVRDLYKVTPVCLRYSINATLKAAMSRSIFVMTEIRPGLIPYKTLYVPFLPLLSVFDELYFIGDKQVYTYLQNNLAITYIPQEQLDAFVELLQSRIGAGEMIALGIKTAGAYNLTALSKV